MIIAAAHRVLCWRRTQEHWNENGNVWVSDVKWYSFMVNAKFYETTLINEWKMYSRCTLSVGLNHILLTGGLWAIPHPATRGPSRFLALLEELECYLVYIKWLSTWLMQLLIDFSPFTVLKKTLSLCVLNAKLQTPSITWINKQGNAKCCPYKMYCLAVLETAYYILLPNTVLSVSTETASQFDESTQYDYK